jgi:hypothetical protein
VSKDCFFLPLSSFFSVKLFWKLEDLPACFHQRFLDSREDQAAGLQACGSREPVHE